MAKIVSDVERGEGVGSESARTCRVSAWNRLESAEIPIGSSGHSMSSNISTNTDRSTSTCLNSANRRIFVILPKTCRSAADQPSWVLCMCVG